jgi:hypothetical protein
LLIIFLRFVHEKQIVGDAHCRKMTAEKGAARLPAVWPELRSASACKRL